MLPFSYGVHPFSSLFHLLLHVVFVSSSCVHCLLSQGSGQGILEETGEEAGDRILARREKRRRKERDTDGRGMTSWDLETVTWQVAQTKHICGTVSLRKKVCWIFGQPHTFGGLKSSSRWRLGALTGVCMASHVRGFVDHKMAAAKKNASQPMTERQWNNSEAYKGIFTATIFTRDLHHMASKKPWNWNGKCFSPNGNACRCAFLNYLPQA